MRIIGDLALAFGIIHFCEQEILDYDADTSADFINACLFLSCTCLAFSNDLRIFGDLALAFGTIHFCEQVLDYDADTSGDFINACLF